MPVSTIPGWLTAWLAGLSQDQRLQYNEDPSTGFYAAMAPLGVGGPSPFAAWQRSQLPIWQQQFAAEEPTRVLPDVGDTGPVFDWLQFINEQNPMAAWGNLAPRQRGENPGLYAPQIRFLRNPWG